MDDLVLLHARYPDGNICTVRTYFHAVLTNAGASEASSALLCIFFHIREISFSSVDRIFICLRLEISYKSTADHSLRGF